MRTPGRECWFLGPDAGTAEKFFLNLLDHYTLEKKASGDEEVRSTLIPGFRAPANALSDDRANLLALRKLLKWQKVRAAGTNSPAAPSLDSHGNSSRRKRWRSRPATRRTSPCCRDPRRGHP